MKSLTLAVFLLFTQLIAAQSSSSKVGHTHDILSVKFSPQDNQLISYSWGDGRLILWDVKSGNLLWIAKTEFIQKADERYNLQAFFWSEDGKSIITKSENGTYQTWNAETGAILNVSETTPNIALKTETTKNVSVTNDYQNFYLTKIDTKENFTIKKFSRTGTVYDVSHDGKLFAEGGSWGNAAIKVTEISTGKFQFLDGRDQQLPQHQPNELEARLATEKRQKQIMLAAAQSQRDKQATIDTAAFQKQIYISFAHYGEMTNPLDLKMLESNEPNKSKEKKTADAANAVWLRLHNDSPLPIQIPTQSMYMPRKDCFYEFSKGQKFYGLCDSKEISIWHGLENKKGKALPYGFDFGSASVLLPKTSTLFAVSLEILKDGNAIRFDYTFFKEAGDKMKEYGMPITLRFRQADLPTTK